MAPAVLSASGPVPGFYWVDQGFGYALTGPLSRDRLLQLARQLKAVTGVSAEVAVLAPDTLPRATHKAKRVEDRRQQVW